MHNTNPNPDIKFTDPNQKPYSNNKTCSNCSADLTFW